MTIETDVPAEWRESVVVRHLYDPYSDASLGEPRRDGIDLGEVDLSGLTEDDYYRLPTLSASGEETVQFLDTDTASTIEAHQLFTDAVKRILGPEKFTQASIGFNSRVSWVGRNELQNGTLASQIHLDSLPEPPRPVLLLHGFACNLAPTNIAHGPFTLGDFQGAVYAGQLRKFLDSEVHSVEPIPANRLIVMPGSAPHATPMPNESGFRHFAHWTVYLPL